MAITFKKKPAPVEAKELAPLPAPIQELTVREEEDLAAVGLTPEKPKSKITIKTKPLEIKVVESGGGLPPIKKAMFDGPSCSPNLYPEKFPGLVMEGEVYSAGDRVRIICPYYPWIKLWKDGDFGTVEKYWPPVPEAKNRLAHGVLLVRLDVVREKGRAEVHLQAWQVKRV